jgi:hypothetical protein
MASQPKDYHPHRTVNNPIPLLSSKLSGLGYKICGLTDGQTELTSALHADLIHFT